MSAAKPANRPGCYKCGQQGHWARDCQAPKESWLPRDFENKGATQQEKAAGADANNEQQAAGTAAAEEAMPMGAAAAARASRKRPKLTFDDLKKPSGLPELYHNFPEAFRRQFRGRGHEAADLRRLLEMFSRWQGRVFPHGSFDNFIASLEKIGAANVVKKEMSDMRMDLLRGVEDKLRGEREEEAAAAVPEELEAEVLEVQNEEEPMLAIDSDDELLELAAMPMEAQGAAGAGMVEEPPPGDLDDDDELLALAAMQDEEGGHSAAPAMPAAPAAVEEKVDDLDDDELLALAEGL